MDEVTRHLGLRERFVEIGDRSLVAEVDAWLARHGVAVTVPTVPPLEETAVPRKETRPRRT